MKSIIIVLAILLVAPLYAQIKHIKTETAHISGNCGMCKTTIEKAGNNKNQAEVVWDKDAKVATLSYDSTKTSKSEILKRIALAGYDNEMFIAPDETYNNLPGCCQYNREKKAHSMGETVSVTARAEVSLLSSPLSKVFNAYFELKDALVKSDAALVFTQAKTLEAELANVKMSEMDMQPHMLYMKLLPKIKEDLKAMGSSDRIETQRANFINLSENFYQLMKVFKAETPTYYQHCPMANGGKGANWLSRKKEIRNPYYGSMMLTCGSTIEELK